MASLKFVQTGIQDQLKAMIDRSNAMQGFLNRNVYAMYKKFQRTRWITEGESEGKKWERLNPLYAARKTKLYKQYPGGGKKMMIATGDLVDAATGKSEKLHKIATNKQLILTIRGIEYATYADEKRTISQWSDKTMKEFFMAISDFAFKNKIGVFK